MDIRKQQILNHPASETSESKMGRCWGSLADENEEEWGVQHPEELLSAIVEEVGELEQAYLEATHEDGERVKCLDEVDDIAPLLFQFLRSIGNHPLAFKPLPTAEEVVDDD